MKGRVGSISMSHAEESSKFRETAEYNLGATFTKGKDGAAQLTFNLS